MKKKTLLILLFLAGSLSSYAQFSRFGAKVGGGFSKAVGTDAPSGTIESKAGAHVGIIYGYDFISSLALQAELQYSRKGFIYQNFPVTPTETYAGDINLDYMELPLLIRVQRFGLFAEAGPYLGYLFRASSDVNRLSTSNTGGTDPIALGQQEFSAADFQRFDYGYAVGAGFMMDNGFFVSIRNTRGIRSISRQDLSQHNRIWQLSLGFLMRPL